MGMLWLWLSERANLQDINVSATLENTCVFWFVCETDKSAAVLYTAVATSQGMCHTLARTKTWRGGCI